MGKLYVVPTPIGNLGDITIRALEVLRNVNYIACEDTRRTIKLLNYYGIEGKKLLSYYSPKEHLKAGRILRILENEDVALVTDAGMPAVSDPGYVLIRECIKKGAEVEVLPGSSAVITALVGSGLPTDRFCFFGFVPKKGLRRFFEELATCQKTTIILFDSPNRILKTLNTLADMYPQSQVCVARELTKIHEEYLRGTAIEVRDWILEREEKIKGEVVLVIRLSPAS